MGSGALVLYYSRPSTLNCGVLMGSGALVLSVNATSRGKKRCNTRTSQEVTHPSTTLAQARLTAEF
ncbi:hypothetical protein Lal_00008535 [Lupinus albus]|nr:hypothetical protein Lal_00008498 [Lupinus albus]KAF1885761.1 hypothetical protein Lal_00008499 [Lupinus albus]KAF1885795.1 hypothetical protein Lal_00008535 [Lupinus albus]